MSEQSWEAKDVETIRQKEQRRADLRLRCLRIWEFLQMYSMVLTDVDSYFAEIEEAESEIDDITRELGYE